MPHTDDGFVLAVRPGDPLRRQRVQESVVRRVGVRDRGGDENDAAQNGGDRAGQPYCALHSLLFIRCSSFVDSSLCVASCSAELVATPRNVNERICSCTRLYSHARRVRATHPAKPAHEETRHSHARNMTRGRRKQGKPTELEQHTSS